MLFTPPTFLRRTENEADLNKQSLKHAYNMVAPGGLLPCSLEVIAGRWGRASTGGVPPTIEIRHEGEVGTRDLDSLEFRAIARRSFKILLDWY